MLRKAKSVSPGDFAATLFFAESVSVSRAGAAADPVAIVHCSKLAENCESQNGTKTGLENLALPGTNEREKFIARLFVVAKRAEHRAGNSLAVLLFHAAHLHAKMARFDNDADALRRDLFFDRARNLAGHAFLNLQPPREHVHKPRHFAQAQNFFRRQIGDVRFAEKRKNVMF